MCHFSTKDFSKKEVKSLAKQGISIVGSNYTPGADGYYQEVVYTLDDNGTSKVRTFREVVNLAA
jgi:hypothetical protein